MRVLFPFQTKQANWRFRGLSNADTYCLSLPKVLWWSFEWTGIYNSSRRKSALWRTFLMSLTFPFWDITYQKQKAAIILIKWVIVDHWDKPNILSDEDFFLISILQAGARGYLYSTLRSNNNHQPGDVWQDKCCGSAQNESMSYLWDT